MRFHLASRWAGRIQTLRCALLSGLACLAAVTASAQAACTNTAPDRARLGVTRVLEIDTTNGPMLGKLTRLPTEPQFLAPGEVVLTFDDGPMPWITRAILTTLEQHCTRAIFFSVGKMAVAYPSVVRETIERGHTMGTHTWSHPLNLKRLKQDAAVAEMERGFAAVATAAGQPIAPFFRFPGLSDSPAMVGHLKQRQVATVTVDVVSNDSYINDPARLTRETLAKVEANRGGILLFHDIKAATAKALPDILRALAERGFKVVHLVPKRALAPRPDLVAQFEGQVARLVNEKARARTALVPFFGTTGPERAPAAPSIAQTATGAMGNREELRETPARVAEIAESAIIPTPTPAQRPASRVWLQPSDAWVTSIRRTFAD
jgi:peptidoglycan-N-acetylglucosamine deacetylase